AEAGGGADGRGQGETRGDARETPRGPAEGDQDVRVDVQEPDRRDGGPAAGTRGRRGADGRRGAVLTQALELRREHGRREHGGGGGADGCRTTIGGREVRDRARAGGPDTRSG